MPNLNDTTRKTETLVMECLCLFIITPSGVRTFFASGCHCNNTRDTQEHIPLTGFMKKTQYNALNIKTVAKQVWLYFIRGTTTNLQIALEKKNSYLNQATRKKYHIFLPPKNPEIENLKPPKSFDHSCHLKPGDTPPGLAC